MELRHLRYFERAAEMLHFTRAAESLYISQPTLSVHIQQLEEELGEPLFARIGRNVRLTEAGDILLEHTRQVLKQLELAQQEITSLQGLMRGTLHTGALLSFSMELVPIWLSSFSRAHPDVRVIVNSATHHVLEQSLLSGEIELGFSFGPIENDEIASEPLFQEQAVLVVPANHAMASSKGVTIQDLHGLDVVLPSRDLNTRRYFDDLMQEADVKPNIIAEMDDLHALLTMVKMGSTATVLARMAVGEHHSLRMIPFTGPHRYMTAVAMWDSRANMSPAAKTFLSIIRTYFQARSARHTPIPD